MEAQGRRKKTAYSLDFPLAFLGTMSTNIAREKTWLEKNIEFKFGSSYPENYTHESPDFTGPMNKTKKNCSGKLGGSRYHVMGTINIFNIL